MIPEPMPSPQATVIGSFSLTREATSISSGFFWSGCGNLVPEMGSSGLKTDPGAAQGLSASRIEALSDGVFAIAMTLLIFQLKVPELPQGASAAALMRDVLALWPQAACFALSFVTAGALWVAHRGQFHYIQRTDRPLLWINIFFLLFVSTIPFVTALVGRYPTYAFAVVLYGANMVLTVLALWCHWHYATRGHRLTSQHLSAAVVRLQSRRILAGPLIYIAAMIFAFWQPWISMACYAIVPIAYALPGAVDRHWLIHNKSWKPVDSDE